MKNVEQIILNKHFEELDSNERVLVQELAVNEEEYDQVKSMLLHVTALNSAEQYSISPRIKKDLDQLFDAKHPVFSSTTKQPEEILIPFYKRVWFQAASILLFVSGIFLFWELSYKNNLQTDHVVAKVEMQKNNAEKHESTKHKIETNSAIIHSENTNKSAPLIAQNKQQNPKVLDGVKHEYKLAEATSYFTDESISQGRIADLNPVSSIAEQSKLEQLDAPTNMELLSLIEASY